MNPESDLTLNPDPSTAKAISYSQVHLKTEGGKLLLILPKPTAKDPANEWVEVWQNLKYCLNHHQGNWPQATSVHLIAGDRLLDSRQLQNLAQALEEAELKLTHVHTSRRQTAVAAATAGYSVEQVTQAPVIIPETKPVFSPLAEPLYLSTTIRSGIEIRHPGSVIILGDVNPGGEVIADGDILIWGWLRGIAHAGAKGNPECRIMSLRMEPTQLRIGEMVARAPANSPQQFEPEVAYVASGGIRITQAAIFNKTYRFDPASKAWLEKNAEAIQYVNAQKLLETKLKKQH